MSDTIGMSGTPTLKAELQGKKDVQKRSLRKNLMWPCCLGTKLTLRRWSAVGIVCGRDSSTHAATAGHNTMTRRRTCTPSLISSTNTAVGGLFALLTFIQARHQLHAACQSARVDGGLIYAVQLADMFYELLYCAKTLQTVDPILLCPSFLLDKPIIVKFLH